MDKGARARAAAAPHEVGAHPLTPKRAPFPFLFFFPLAGWTYWELRCEWKATNNKKQDWKELPTPLFDVDTVEDFWVCYNKCPKIV